MQTKQEISLKDERRKVNRRDFCNKAGSLVISRIRVIGRAELNISFQK